MRQTPSARATRTARAATSCQGSRPSSCRAHFKGLLPCVAPFKEHLPCGAPFAPPDQTTSPGRSPPGPSAGTRTLRSGGNPPSPSRGTRTSRSSSSPRGNALRTTANPSHSHLPRGNARRTPATRKVRHPLEAQMTAPLELRRFSFPGSLTSTFLAQLLLLLRALRGRNVDALRVLLRRPARPSTTSRPRDTPGVRERDSVRVGE